MATKLTIYNGALRCLGERKTTLTENREPRRLLDDVWDAEGVKRCLQMGQWNFAIRSTEQTYSPSITPAFSYRYAFDKPDDFVRTVGVCSDEYFKCTLEDYRDEAGYWWADLDTIYVRYVSDDTDYGFDLARWPPNFTAFVEAWFALQIAPRMTGSETAKALTQRDVDKLLNKAKATDAQEEAMGRQQSGCWVRSRRGSGGTDRTPSGNLY